MLFRTTTGELNTIQRKDYATDIEYYKCIMMTIDPNATSEPSATQFSSLRAIAKVVTLEQNTDTT